MLVPISGLFGKAHVKAEGLLTLAADVLLFVLMQLVLVRVPWRNFREGSYPASDTARPLPVSVDSSQAESLFKIGQEDSAATDDKVKQLLALSASLATLTLVFGRDARPAWLFVFLVAALVAVVLLCVSVFRVRKITVPTIEDDPDAQARQWGRDILRSYYANRATHNFRTDQYRTAHRYFVLALVSLAFLAALAVQKPDPAKEIAQALQRIERFGLRLQQADPSGAWRPSAPAGSRKDQ
jgi:hypothetical protein